MTSSWNQTGHVLTLGDMMNINPNGTDFAVEVQAGYPYIGLPTYSFNETIGLINATLNSDKTSNFRCNGDGWDGGISQCYWYHTYCNEVVTNDLAFNLTLYNVNGNMTFSLPLKNLLGDS